jgi:hypothetical protein
MTYSYTQVHDPNLMYRLYLLISWSFIFFAEIQWIEHYRSHWFTENIRVEKRLTLINPSLNITCVKYRLFYHNFGFQQISLWLSLTVWHDCFFWHFCHIRHSYFRGYSGYHSGITWSGDWLLMIRQISIQDHDFRPSQQPTILTGERRDSWDLNFGLQLCTETLLRQIPVMW